MPSKNRVRDTTPFNPVPSALPLTEKGLGILKAAKTAILTVSARGLAQAFSKAELQQIKKAVIDAIHQIELTENLID